MIAPKKKLASPTFRYEGTDSRGHPIKGDLSVRSMALAKITLRKQGINIKSIRVKRHNHLESIFKRRISPLDISIFTRQLATMIKAGVPLVQSFEIVNESLENPNMREVVNGIKNKIEGGSTFAAALRQYPLQFDHLFCSLIESGEQSGSLEIMLDRVAIYKEKSEILKSKIKKAMRYPIAVVVVALVVTIVLMIKVVPIFQDLFNSFGAELPAFTQFVIAMSKWMQAYWWILIAIIVGFIIGIKQLLRRSAAFRDFLDRLILKLPIFGSLVYKSIIARYSRTLATTFAAGVPLIDALEFTAAATNNIVYHNAVLKIRDEIATGQQLQYAMRASQLFPPMVNQMVAIGEEAGALDAMLEKVATHYESEVDNAVDGLTSLMEPIIMVVLGVLVAGLVVAMYLPIFEMGSVV